VYANILVPLDGSATSERGLQEAINLAKALKSRLHLLHVIDEYPLMVEMSSYASFDQMRQAMRDYGSQQLAGAQRAAAEQGLDAQTHLEETSGGRVAEAILAQAQTLGCDLVVMGTHGRRGLRRTLLGSDAELVLRGSSVPVLLVRRAADAA